MFSIHNDPERRDLRSDVSGALSVILDNAPYGPNVDEAKVHPAVLRSLTFDAIPPLSRNLLCKRCSPSSIRRKRLR